MLPIETINGAIASMTAVGNGTQGAGRLPPHIVVLGVVSFLTAMSSAMVYGLLPVFLVSVLQTTVVSVGLIEGLAEATTSLTKIASGMASDRLGRRKPIVLIGYSLSAVNKLLFPLAGDAATVLIARVVDRLGKGTRDAPRDAFLTDVTPATIRGSGFGLRLTFYTAGFVVGPLLAIGLMRLSGDDIRLVFWVAVVPAAAAVVVLLLALREPARPTAASTLRLRPRWSELAQFPKPFWWAIAAASLLSLARFSHAFLVLKTHEVGVAPTYIPLMLVLMHLVYAATAYPFGALADHVDRRRQLGLGVVVLLAADMVLATTDSIAMTAFGVTLWGLQLAVTQGLLSATVADAAPEPLRGTAFGIYELAVGIATFVASTVAGALWMIGGSQATFAAGAAIAVGVILLLLLGPTTEVRTSLGSNGHR